MWVFTARRMARVVGLAVVLAFVAGVSMLSLFAGEWVWSGIQVAFLLLGGLAWWFSLQVERKCCGICRQKIGPKDTMLVLGDTSVHWGCVLDQQLAARADGEANKHVSPVAGNLP